jgi:hypothetical protein
MCEWYACIYACHDGCSIKGYMDAEGKVNGKKEHCPHYDVMCISAKCSRCAHNGCDVCSRLKDKT